MSLALSSRWYAPATPVEGLLEGLRSVGLRHLGLLDPPRAAALWRPPLSAAGVGVTCVLLEDERAAALAPTFPEALRAAADVAAPLKAGRLVVRGGPHPGPAGAELEELGRRLAAQPDAPEAEGWRDRARALRGRGRERLVEGIARALHGPLAEGLPLAVEHAVGPADVLGFQETGWLLEALPRLGLWLDPAAAAGAARAQDGPALSAWLDAHARRVVGARAQGLGSDGRGHAHPEDRGPDWGSLGDCLPRGLPWVLDVSGALSAADVRDAVRYLVAARAFGPGGKPN